MRRKSSLISCATLVAFVFIQSGCPSHSDEMRPIGPEVKASLIIYFKQGVTNQQVEDFWHGVLSKPDPRGRGYYHRNGVSDIGKVSLIQGHEGISMSFFPDATKEEREKLIHDVTSSPIVHKVLRDIAPADVKKLDDGKELVSPLPVVKPQ